MGVQMESRGFGGGYQALLHMQDVIDYVTMASKVMQLILAI